MRASRLVVASLLLAACKDSPPTNAQPSASPSSSPPPVASSVAPAPVSSSTAAAERAKLPPIETVAVKSCPAPMARVKVGDDTVELIGCPEEVASDTKRTATKSQLILRDQNGKTRNIVRLTEVEPSTVKLALEDLYGDGRPTFFVTVTVPTMGSWAGPTTSLYEIRAVSGGMLERVQVASEDGGLANIELVSAIKRSWWLHPARAGKGRDIYSISTSADNKDIGHRYAFENGKWTDHSGPLKKWTGEHLADTEAEFP